MPRTVTEDATRPEDEEVGEGWYPDPDDETGSWLRYWDGAAWSDTPAKLATKKERESSVWPAMPTIQALDEPASIQIEDLLLLGGYGFPFLPMSRYEVVFGPSDVTVEGPGQGAIETATIPYFDLTNLSIGGPGKVRKGGGFIGGGFGLGGFVVGVAAASVLNSLTTRSRIEALVGLQAGQHELIFLSTSIEPATLELRLSRVRGLMRSSAPANNGEPDLTAKLTRLADLVERGFLERSEYDKLKSELLEKS